MLHFIADGVYTLMFRSSCREAGFAPAGVAIVRGGWLIGSDPGGCIINGRLARPSHPGLAATFEGSIFVPPDSELITGQIAGPEGLNLSVRAAAIASATGLSFLAEVGGKHIDVSASYVGPLPFASKPGTPGVVA